LAGRSHRWRIAGEEMSEKTDCSGGGALVLLDSYGALDYDLEASRRVSSLCGSLFEMMD
jgi:hypothetical protein